MLNVPVRGDGSALAGMAHSFYVGRTAGVAGSNSVVRKSSLRVTLWLMSEINQLYSYYKRSICYKNEVLLLPKMEGDVFFYR